MIHPALPGEGVFHQVARWAHRGSPIRIAWYRPEPAAHTIRATVAWIDPMRTFLALYPGTLNPPQTPGQPRGPTMVPRAARHKLLATFNSGFYLATVHGAQAGAVHAGFAVNGHVYSPMRRGLATLLVHRDGHVEVRAWSAGRSLAPDVVVARQNLPMLVAHGRVSPLARRDAVWGLRYANEPLVARTAICVNREGQVLYMEAPDQTAASLAHIAVHVGCLRAMELDINNTWPAFIVYGRAGGAEPRLTFANPEQVPTRFTAPGEKDFFAVYLRRPGATVRREPF